MFWITEDALLVCRHQLGKVQNVPSQDLLTIGRRRVLVEPDPQGRSISGCPNYGPTIAPCVTTLKVDEGYSQWVHVLGQRLCLDTVKGFTNGTPPGVVQYLVSEPGQAWVSER